MLQLEDVSAVPQHNDPVSTTQRSKFTTIAISAHHPFYTDQDASTTSLVKGTPLMIILVISLLASIICSCIVVNMTEDSLSIVHYRLTETTNYKLGWISSRNMNTNQNYQQLDKEFNSDIHQSGLFFGTMMIITVIISFIMFFILFCFNNIITQCEKYCFANVIQSTVFYVIVAIVWIISVVSIIVWQVEFDKFCNNYLDAYYEHFGNLIVDSECRTGFGIYLAYASQGLLLIGVLAFSRSVPKLRQIIIDEKNHKHFQKTNKNDTAPLRERDGGVNVVTVTTQNFNADDRPM